MKIDSLILVLTFCIVSHQAVAEQFDKKAFYKTLSSESLTGIENSLTAVKALSLPESEAYEGALMMKKAGLLKEKKAQLELFKEGRTKLEHAIAENSGNAEFRFLRLIIQENAPAILGYNKQIQSDSTFISEKYNGMSSLLKTIISDYTKQSKNLKLPGN